MTLVEEIALLKASYVKDTTGATPAGMVEVLFGLIDSLAQEQVEGKVPYKTFLALVSQTGTGTITLDQVLIDEIGISNMVITRYGEGIFVASVDAGKLPIATTLVSPTIGSSVYATSPEGVTFLEPYMALDDSLGLNVKEFVSNTAGTFAKALSKDGVLYRQVLEIRVLNS